MSRFKKQSHTIWFCEYHVVWCPKYRYRVLAGKVKEEVELCVRDQTQQMECEVVELNVQADHVHLVVLIPPKVRISPVCSAFHRFSLLAEEAKRIATIALNPISWGALVLYIRA